MTLSPVLSMNNDAFTSIIKLLSLSISFHVSPSLVVFFHCILFVLAYSEDLWPAINNRSYFTLLRIYRDFTLQLLVDVFSFI